MACDDDTWRQNLRNSATPNRIDPLRDDLKASLPPEAFSRIDRQVAGMEADIRAAIREIRYGSPAAAVAILLGTVGSLGPANDNN